MTTTRVASGLASPVFLTSPPGDTARAFIVESAATSTSGRIRILNLPGNTLEATPYLTVSGIAAGGEQGLLGLAFHPSFATNGRFYVNYTDAAGDTRIVRYQANVPYMTSTTADAASAQLVLFVDQPFSNHNGGWLGFGPDGYLYCALGDGGSAGDPGNRAQTISNMLLGKMLRLDVNGADAFPGDPNKNYAIPPTNPFVGVTGDDEIWAFGLRNPWRNGFDRATGELYIGDVGQNAWEEIDVQPARAG
jgi:glucose/arabinose dehydrogenase